MQRFRWGMTGSIRRPPSEGDQMRMKFLLSALGVLAFLALGAVASGCGGSDSSSDPSTTSASAESGERPEPAADRTAPADAATVPVKMDEFKFVPADLTAKAGSTAIEAENSGKMPARLLPVRAS